MNLGDWSIRPTIFQSIIPRLTVTYVSGSCPVLVSPDMAIAIKSTPDVIYFPPLRELVTLE